MEPSEEDISNLRQKALDKIETEAGNLRYVFLVIIMEYSLSYSIY